MKKNLLALLVLLVLAALAAQFTRNAGQDPQWTSLRQDAIQCLNALWPGDNAQVTVIPSLDGPILIAHVQIPSEVTALRRGWTYDVLGMVSARHPQVQLAEIRVNDSGKGLQRNLDLSGRERQLTILRRQRQAEVDQLMPPETALVLLDAEFAPGQVPLERDDGPSARKASPYQPPLVPIRTKVWLVLTQEPPAGLIEQFKPDRVVRLPQP